MKNIRDILFYFYDLHVQIYTCKHTNKLLHTIIIVHNGTAYLTNSIENLTQFTVYLNHEIMRLYDYLAKTVNLPDIHVMLLQFLII